MGDKLMVHEMCHTTCHIGLALTLNSTTRHDVINLPPLTCLFYSFVLSDPLSVAIGTQSATK